MKIVFFDLETGGLQPQHPIIQIAAVAVDESLEEVEAFEVKLTFDEDAADAEALVLNHYNRDLWAAEAVSPGDACDRLAIFLKRHADVKQVGKKSGKPYKVAQLAGHNAAAFDMPRLRELFIANERFLPGTYLAFDTLQRAVWHFHEHPELQKPENMKLPSLAKHYGIDGADAAHDALADVRLTVAVYKALRKTLS